MFVNSFRHRVVKSGNQFTVKANIVTVCSKKVSTLCAQWINSIGFEVYKFELI